MKVKLVLIFLLVFQCSVGMADTISIKPVSRFMLMTDKVTSSRTYRMTYIGVPLVIGGLIVKSEDDHFGGLRNEYLPQFHQHYDDYLQYIPAVAMLGMKIGGVKGRSSWARMITSDAFSAILMATTINSLKYTAKVMRPDGSERNSFPSGHTATAFMTATMMRKEYGVRNPWYSIGAYSMATATGLTRMANNKHWLSDVMVGAGIGILSTELGYYLADLIFKDRGITHFTDSDVFDRMRHPSFFGVYLGFSKAPGSYQLPDGSQVSFATSSNAGVEGAWFMNPFIGVGGRFSVSGMPVSINGISQTDNLDMVSSYAGIYLSYPLSPRWAVGTKLLLGYNYYYRCNFESSTAITGGKGGLGSGTGISMNYMAHENFCVRFFIDYNAVTSPVQGNKTLIHLITLGASANVAF